MPQTHWYLLQTKPNQEARALTNLEQQGYPVFCPMLSVEKLRRGKVSMAPEAMFARYLFIQLDSSRSGLGWASIRSTLGVSHLVSFGGVPAKVDATLIARLQQREQQAAPEHLFHAEERLLIADGPFAGLEAIYQATRNPYLRQEVLRIRTRTGYYRMHAFGALGHLEASYQQHESIMNAFLAKDPELAAKAMALHMRPATDASGLTNFIVNIPKESLAA